MMHRMKCELAHSTIAPDVYVERGEHEHAIRDRSEVLALKETSPDRRYIALVRQPLAYCNWKCASGAG